MRAALSPALSGSRDGTSSPGLSGDRALASALRPGRWRPSNRGQRRQMVQPVHPQQARGLIPDVHPDTGQPVGFRIDPQPAALPQAVMLRGRYGSVERLDAARHRADLWDAVAGHRHIWTYMRYGPFSDPAVFSDWLVSREETRDPFYYAIGNPHRGALGLASLFRLFVRRHFPRPHYHQGPQPRHRLVRDAGNRVAGPEGRVRTVAGAGEFQPGWDAEEEARGVERSKRARPVGWAKAHCPEQDWWHGPSCAFAHAVRPCPFDRVGKVARGTAKMSLAAAGDFAHPTGLVRAQSSPTLWAATAAARAARPRGGAAPPRPHSRSRRRPG